MIKKILPISIFVLVLIIIIILGLQNLLNKNKTQTNTTVTPTLYEGKYGSGYSGGNNVNNSGNNTGKTIISEDTLKATLPVNKADFTFDHSDKLGKYVVTLKTDEGQTAYDQWISQNADYGSLLSEQQIMFAYQSVAELDAALDYAEKNKLSPEKEFKKNTDTLLNIVNTLFSPISNPKQTTSIPTPIPTQKPQTNSGTGNYVYYAQCGGPYGSYPLPKGSTCTNCDAGCGPTTAAMIISSYVDSTMTPPKVIDDMSKKGISITCDGTGYGDLYTYIKNAKGIKTDDVITTSSSSAQEVANDYRKFTSSGWTLLVRARHTISGHYFWVTDVTADGQILAYDPAYGVGRPKPINQNLYAPYPYYLNALPVKKL